MKKLLFILPATLLAASAFAATVTVKGGTSRVAINSTGATAADDLIMDSTAGNQYSGVDGFIVKSITNTTGNGISIALPGGGSFLTVDVNAASGNVNAMDVVSWQMNYYSLRIKNSAESSTAKTSINFGNSLNLSSGATGQFVQTQEIRFENINGTLTAKIATIGNAINEGKNTSTLTIDANSAITADCANGFTVAKSGVMNVQGTFTQASYTTFEAGSTLNITGNFITTAGKQLTLNGTATTNKAMSFCQLLTAGKFTQTAGDGATFQRTATFNSGADWTILGKITLQGGDATASRLASFTVEDGAKIVITTPTSGDARIVFRGNNNLIMNGGSFIDQNGKSIALTTYGGLTNNKLTINSDQTFKKLYANNATLDIILDDTSKLIFDYEGQSLTFDGANGKINIYNFRENSVYVGNNTEMIANINANVTAYDSANTQLGLVGVSNGWLTIVPEPSTYAAIFGALALALAVYRRRK